MRRTGILAACVAALAVISASHGPRLHATRLRGATAPARQAATSATIDRAFREFWAAADPKDAARKIDVVLKTGVAFEEALSRVAQGHEYSPAAARGRQRARHRTFDGADHAYTFVVPERYDPSRKYQVRVQLHGGVARPEPPDLNRLGIDRLPGTVEEISVYPTGWASSVWWSPTQVENLSKILDRLKRTYNIDENRVYLTGGSDGGTGAYFFAFRDTTPWASFLPLIGNMTVLASPDVGTDGEIFPGNAVNKPFFVVNAGRDRLYPAHIVQFYVEHLEKLGADVTFHVQAESEHSTAWWPLERAAFEKFVSDHPRDPLPDRLSWETERTDRYNRAHWVVIDRLGRFDGESDLPDSNLLQRGREYDFGLRIDANEERGRRLAGVIANSNAHRIGLQAGDLVLEVDGRSVGTGRDLFDAMQRWTPGAHLSFTIERGAQRVGLEGRYQPDEIDVPPIPIFPRTKPSGRIEVVRKGNVVEVSTRGVRAFTLLLAPSEFDFRQPIRVVANRRTVFDQVVAPRVDTLMKWAARDNDRTMVFGAEVNIELK